MESKTPYIYGIFLVVVLFVILGVVADHPSCSSDSDCSGGATCSGGSCWMDCGSDMWWNSATSSCNPYDSGGTTCSSSTVAACYTSSECTGVGGFWCGTWCQFSVCSDSGSGTGTCSVEYYYNCNTQSLCEGLGKYRTAIRTPSPTPTTSRPST